MENKVLNAFSRITLNVDYDNDSSYDCLQFEDDCKGVEQALQELDDIKNSKSNDAMKYLEKEIKDLENKLEKDIKLRDKLTIYQHNALENCVSRISKYESKLKQLSAIKQCILKAQQQEKVLSIIKEKTLNILLLELAQNVDEYNERIIPNGKLTQDEFDTLKRWVR